MTKPLPSPELLRKILRYDPKSGRLFWRDRTPDMFRAGNTGSDARCRAWNTTWSGLEALCSVKGNDYLYGRVFDRNLYAHRVAWTLHYGLWPLGEIDHKNGNKRDNRIENLKDVTRRENARNQKNRKGRVFSNIYKDARNNFWVVQVSGRHHFMSKCFGLSIRARNEKLRALGYSERHVQANTPHASQTH